VNKVENIACGKSGYALAKEIAPSCEEIWPWYIVPLVHRILHPKRHLDWFMIV